MKTFHLKLRSSSLILLLLPCITWAKPVAQVTMLEGQVFAVSPEGKTRSLTVNDHLEEKSEVMVGEGSFINLNDYYDVSYHLIPGSHIKVFDKSFLLKNGKAWVKSQNTKHPVSLTTANGHVEFVGGEFIATFDQGSSKSQFLVAAGEVEVSNVLEKNLKYTVPAGTFTLVDPNIENGAPRAPTRVGPSSMTSAIDEFKGGKVAQMGPSKVVHTRARVIASVEEKSFVPKGEIIFIKSSSVGQERKPASVSGGAFEYWNKNVNSKNVFSAPIKFYGFQEMPIPAKREPASLKIIPPIPIKTSSKAEVQDTDKEFMRSLRQATGEQPKYPKELDALIKDLKSF